MKFLDSPLATVIIGVIGVIIGSIISGVFTVLSQRFSNQRQERQLAHDLEVREKQLAHEREQEIRGRRTAALADLHMLLEDQAAALQGLWGCIRNPDRSTANKARRVLDDKSYRRKLWPINLPASKAINEYAEKTHDLLSFLHHNEMEFTYLWADEIPPPDHKLCYAVEQKIESALTSLGTAIKEVTNLTSELNDIQVRKAT